MLGTFLLIPRGRCRQVLTLGIYEAQQYLRLGSQRRFSGPRVAYNLLDVGDHPTPEQIRLFEDICFTLRTSNGTFRTTFRNRFHDVDALAGQWIQKTFESAMPIRIQDRAVSSGLTSCEWAKSLFPLFPNAVFEASDLLIELLEHTSPSGEIFITEPNGAPLQYISPPFVTALDSPESWRNPLLRWVAARAKGRFEKLPPGSPRRSISCIHPEARSLAATHPGFSFQVRSVFDRTPTCHVIRTMNILNLGYFPAAKLAEAVSAVFDSMEQGGIWIVGRTLEEDFTNHATLFRRGEQSWEILDRIGKGSEIEAIAAGAAAAL